MLLSTSIIFSCQNQTALEKGQLEGVWETQLLIMKISNCLLFYGGKILSN